MFEKAIWLLDVVLGTHRTRNGIGSVRELTDRSKHSTMEGKRFRIESAS